MRTKKSKKGLRTLIDEINHRAANGMCHNTELMSLLEVGAFAGDATEIFIENFYKVKCVDPWENNIGDITNYVNMDNVYECWKETTKKKVPELANVFSYKGTFREYYKKIKGIESYDMIYIDALHDYESVKADIERAKKLIVPGGIIAGHDYCDRFPGVMRAVDEAFGRPDCVTSDTSWFRILEE
jgi:hypothetical protein